MAALSELNLVISWFLQRDLEEEALVRSRPETVLWCGDLDVIHGMKRLEDLEGHSQTTARGNVLAVYQEVGLKLPNGAIRPFPL